MYVVVFDHKLRWDKWTEAVNKKGQLRIYFFRKTVSFNISDLRFYLKCFYILHYLLVWKWQSGTKEFLLRKVLNMANYLVSLEKVSTTNLSHQMHQ